MWYWSLWVKRHYKTLNVSSQNIKYSRANVLVATFAIIDPSSLWTATIDGLFIMSCIASIRPDHSTDLVKCHSIMHSKGQYILQMNLNQKYPHVNRNQYLKHLLLQTKGTDLNQTPDRISCIKIWNEILNLIQWWNNKHFHAVESPPPQKKGESNSPLYGSDGGIRQTDIIFFVGYGQSSNFYIARRFGN